MLNSEWVNAIVSPSIQCPASRITSATPGELRHERERLLLDLRGRLEQADRRDRSPSDTTEDRRRELGREQDRLHRDVDDCVIGHGELLRTSDGHATVRS